ENEQYAVTNPAQQLTSKAYDSSWSTIEQALSDSYSKVILGAATLDDYEATIENLRGQGLDDVIAEYTEAYEALSCPPSPWKGIPWPCSISPPPPPSAADGDLATRRLQQAIDAASSRGGGRVVVSAGVHRTGALHLRSGIELHL